jgi:hypothetical protein
MSRWKARTSRWWAIDSRLADGDLVEPPDDARHQAEPVLGVYLQRNFDSGGSGCALSCGLHAGFLRNLHPVMAALAMALSSITVVTSSLRLKHLRIE